jgi:hypothetical protein
VRIVPAHFDVCQFTGQVSDMAASPATEAAMAAAMLATYRDPRRPALPPAIIASFDRRAAYDAYVALIQRLLSGDQDLARSGGRSWPRELEATA